MLTKLAIANYRSLRDVVVPLGQLNVITGANGSGKSNLYRALRLLSEVANGGVVNALAAEGGLDSTFWAGPENLTRAMRSGEMPIQGGPRKDRVRLQLGFATEEFGYTIALGLPQPSRSAFALDPEIKRECIWAGDCYRPAAALIDRDRALVKIRKGRSWQVLDQQIDRFDSLYDQVADPDSAPEVFQLRHTICSWRFYDHFRTDNEAPARQPQLGTRTPVLHHDGRDLAAALQTIQEIGDAQALQATIADAFPGATLQIKTNSDGRFGIEFQQQGLLRPLSGAELSDGTLRYLLWVAALLTPRPPALMVLNEPETSLHPDLLPALARLIESAAASTQVWIVSHAQRLIASLEQSSQAHNIQLEKELGQTTIVDQGLLDTPSWHWPS